MIDKYPDIIPEEEDGLKRSSAAAAPCFNSPGLSLASVQDIAQKMVEHYKDNPM
jgi:beta-galactosidase GanA